MEGRILMNSAEDVKAPKKMKKWQKVILIVLLVIVGLMLAAAIALYAVFSHFYNKMNYVPIDDSNETIVYDIPDETDYPLDELDSIPTQTVTDSEGNQLPPVTVAPSETTPPVTEDPKVEEEVKESIDNNVNTNNNNLIKVGKNVRNILLVGTDGLTVNDRGRSDTMILLTINENTGKITMTSIMRDIYLYIPGVGAYNRINASYAYGGIPMLVDTIRQNFKLEIDEYVRVNFNAFEYIVDTMGGVDIVLTQEEINYVGLGGKAQPGLVHLNGAQALAYCRCRSIPKGKLDGDFSRTARQREFLTIMSEKLRGMSISELSELVDVFLPYVTTNLTQTDILGLLAKAPKYLNYEIESARLPVDGSWQFARIRGMSVITVDFQKNINALKKIVAGN